MPILRGLLAVCAFGLAGTSGSLQAQEEYHVTGIVQDTAGAPISGAMAVALTAADSVLAKYALTTGDGSFRLGRLPVGAYILQVTLIGHQTVRRPFELADSDIDAGVVTMRTMAVEMDPLVVSVEQVPFVVRRDTLSYNVAAFETPPNAMVEDLLKRLPGIDVDNDGTITAQGEEVENVLVDGREFFGPDPTIATRNLPADAVRQVDVFDKQSDVAEFTGIPDGDDERTIDLRLHEDARAGRFGRLSGGFGRDVDNDLRYEGRININRFSPTMQLSLAANTDNVNRENFAASELFSALGALGQLGGLGGLGRGGFGGGSSGAPGFTESLGVGLNANRDFDDSGWIRSSYFLSQIDNQRDQLVQEQALFGEKVASLSTQTGASSSARSSHRVNLNAEYSPSPRQRLRLRATVRRGFSDASSVSERTTVTDQPPPLNMANTKNMTDGEEWRGNARVTWMRRLSDEGGSIVAEFRSGIQDSDEDTDHRSTITATEPGGAEIVRILVQHQESDLRTLDNSLRLSLTQPLGERYTMEAFGRASGVDQLQDQVVSDVIEVRGSAPARRQLRLRATILVRERWGALQPTGGGIVDHRQRVRTAIFTRWHNPGPRHHHLEWVHPSARRARPEVATEGEPHDQHGVQHLHPRALAIRASAICRQPRSDQHLHRQPRPAAGVQPPSLGGLPLLRRLQLCQPLCECESELHRQPDRQGANIRRARHPDGDPDQHRPRVGGELLRALRIASA